MPLNMSCWSLSCTVGDCSSLLIRVLKDSQGCQGSQEGGAREWVSLFSLLLLTGRSITILASTDIQKYCKSIVSSFVISWLHFIWQRCKVSNDCIDVVDLYVLFKYPDTSVDLCSARRLFALAPAVFKLCLCAAKNRLLGPKANEQKLQICGLPMWNWLRALAVGSWQTWEASVRGLVCQKLSGFHLSAALLQRGTAPLPTLVSALFSRSCVAWK